MKFLNRLKAHIGGLIRIKSQLYWYNSCAWDKNPDRICLVLAVANYGVATIAVDAQTDASVGPANPVLAQLMIDGDSCWVWLTNEYVELITGGDQ